MFLFFIASNKKLRKQFSNIFLQECNNMNILKEQKTKYQTSAFSLVFGLFFASFGSKVYANDQQQTLVLVGGALTTCSSMSPKNCLSNKQISGKQNNQYR
ncbi:MAG: cyanophycinase, partial [Pseudomonadota bacterium]|nr:cyanophycinase [Pseudomonadota bacterium]